MNFKKEKLQQLLNERDEAIKNAHSVQVGIDVDTEQLKETIKLMDILNESIETATANIAQLFSDMGQLATALQSFTNHNTQPDTAVDIYGYDISSEGYHTMAVPLLAAVPMDGEVQYIPNGMYATPAEIAANYDGMYCEQGFIVLGGGK